VEAHEREAEELRLAEGSFPALTSSGSGSGDVGAGVSTRGGGLGLGLGHRVLLVGLRTKGNTVLFEVRRLEERRRGVVAEEEAGTETF
jgi:hypothetical protein